MNNNKQLNEAEYLMKNYGEISIILHIICLFVYFSSIYLFYKPLYYKI